MGLGFVRPTVANLLGSKPFRLVVCPGPEITSPKMSSIEELATAEFKCVENQDTRKPRLRPAKPQTQGNRVRDTISGTSRDLHLGNTRFRVPSSEPPYELPN